MRAFANSRKARREDFVAGILEGLTYALQVLKSKQNATPTMSLTCARSARASAARSPMMMQGAMVLPVVTRGMIEASAMRRF
jgi:hypothetical protein